MKTKDLHEARLTSLQFSDNDPPASPLVKETDVLTGKEVLARHSGPVGTLAFVVRRAGWPLVRGDARIIHSKMKELEGQSPQQQQEKESQEQSQMPPNHNSLGFKLVSIVKEIGIDDEGLHDFATDYFPYPTYKDQSRTFYTALGSGKLSLGLNPLNYIKLILDSTKRIKELGVTKYNSKGEGFIQGGWILFDKDGLPKAAFQENAKVRVPIDDILKEMQNMHDEMGQN